MSEPHLNAPILMYVHMKLIDSLFRFFGKICFAQSQMFKENICVGISF